MSHTPGPWEVTTGTATSYFGVGTMSGQTQIGVRIFNEDDANLIAAAPDTMEQRNELLDALENLLKEHIKTVVGEWGDKAGPEVEREPYIIAGRAAIAKATGEAA